VRTLTTLLILVGLATGDTVITKMEVIHCSVVEADTVCVRLKLPSGGIRMLSTKDILEVRVADSARLAVVIAQLPATKVVLDAGQAVPAVRGRADEVGEIGAVPSERSLGRPSLDATTDRAATAGPRVPFVSLTALVGGAVYAMSVDEGSLFQLTPNVILFPTSWLGLGADLSLTSISEGSDRERITSAGPKVLLMFGGQNRIYLGAGFGVVRSEGWNSDQTGRRLKLSFGGFAYARDHIVIPLEIGVMLDKLGNSYSSESMRTIAFGVGLAGLLY